MPGVMAELARACRQNPDDRWAIWWDGEKLCSLSCPDEGEASVYVWHSGRTCNEMEQVGDAGSE